MKSSTIRRSALSKESMNVIENLANEKDENMKNNNNINENSAPSEYYRENDSNSESENKAKEIDLLWQTFKSPQFNTNSTFAHVFCGFILGVVVTVVAIFLYIMFALNSDNPSKYDVFNMIKNGSQTESVKSKVENAEETASNAETSSIEEVETPVLDNKKTEEAAPAKAQKHQKAKKSKDAKASDNNAKKIQVKKYVIKDGDTVEGIIKKNYGAYTQERADAIMKVNKLKDLDHIGIDQELLLPVEK